MQIKAHVADGFLAFECDGIFTEPVKKVVLQRDTGLFRFFFGRSGDVVELDCPLDFETIDTLKGDTKCGLGLFYKGLLLASALVPLEME